MNRRLFLHSGSLTSASLIFTKIIWQKDKPSVYRQRTKINGNPSALFFRLSILHSAIKELPKANASEKKLAVIVEQKDGNTGRKAKPSAQFTYEILSSELLRTEKILAEEVNIHLVKAKLVSCTGDHEMHPGLGETLEFAIKPGLSATISGEKEIYLPYCDGDE